MPLKSVIEVDVNDEKFQAFQARFQAYEDAVAAMPGAWGKIANGTDMAATALDALGKKASGQNSASTARALALGRASELQKRADGDALTRMGKLQKGTELLAGTVGRTSLSWKTISGDTKKVFDHIDGATKSLLKWSLMKGIFAGLTGAGGALYGLDKLAGSAAAGRRSAAGLGISFGEQRAFGTDYNRFVDGDAMLSNVAAAKTDITSPAYQGLLGAGLTGKQIQSGNAADVSVDFLHRLPQMFKGVSPGLIGPNAEARGLTNILSAEDIKRYVTASPAERAQQDKAYQSDKKSMNVDGGSLKAWTDLNSQLTRASTEIEKAFIQGLAPLAPEITDLSKSFVKLVGDFAGSKEIKSDLDALVTGLGNFEKAVNDPDSWWNKGGKALDKFSKAEANAGHATHEWLHKHAPWATADYWSGGDKGYSGKNGATNNAMLRGRAANDVPDAVHQRAMDKLRAWGGGQPKADESGAAVDAARGQVGSRSDTGTTPDTMPSTSPQSGDENAKQSEVKAYIRARAAERGIDPDTAVRVALSEGLRGWDTGRDGPSHAGDYNTSFGAYQLHYGGSGIPGMNAMGLGDDFTKQTGMDARDPKTWRSQVDFALTRAAKAGWTDWHGAANTGIGKWEGIGTYRGSVPRTGTPTERGTIGDRAAFEAEQRQAVGQARADDAERLRRYHEQQAAPTLPHPQSHWTKLSDARAKDDAFTGSVKPSAAATQTGHQMLHDALMGAVSAKTKAANDRLFSDDDLAAVKAARGARPAGDDQGSSLDRAKNHSSGLGFDKLHQKRWHDIRVTAPSGSDVSQLAGPASYG